MRGYLVGRVLRRTDAGLEGGGAGPLDAVSVRLSWLAGMLELGISPKQEDFRKQFKVSQSTASKDFATLVGVVNAQQEKAGGALRLGLVAGRFFTGTVLPEDEDGGADRRPTLLGMSFEEVASLANWRPVEEDPPVFDWQGLENFGFVRGNPLEILRQIKPKTGKVFYKVEDHVPQDSHMSALVLLYRACREKREVSFEYLSLSEKGRKKGYTTRRVAAHALVDALGRVHLSGMDMGDSKMKDFVISRMRGLEMGPAHRMAFDRLQDVMPADISLQLVDASEEMRTAIRRAYGHRCIQQGKVLVLPAIPRFLHHYVKQILGVLTYTNPYFVDEKRKSPDQGDGAK